MRQHRSQAFEDKALVSGKAALARRDKMEAAVTRRFPAKAQPVVSEVLTRISGVAPSSTGGKAIWKGSERRAFLGMTAALGLGAAGVLAGGGPLVAKAGAGLLLVHGMRQFSSVVGHFMTHGADVLPGLISRRGQRAVYDAIGAMLMLPGFKAYREAHMRHHAFTASDKDADQQFIAFLGARFDGPVRFAMTMLEPRFHAKFLWERAKAAVGAGPWWRRVLAVATPVAIAAGTGAAGLLAWVAFAVVAYQTATLTQWASEHLWGLRPAGLNARETAVAVTYGRLLLPDPDERWLFWPRMAGYALFRFLLVTGDLAGGHDLHHLGEGPWTEYAYARTRLILAEGEVELRQTVTLRDLFGVAFRSAMVAAHREGRPPLPPRAMDGGRMLGM